MQELRHVSAGAAVQITRAAPMFDHLVEAVLSQRYPESSAAPGSVAGPQQHGPQEHGLQKESAGSQLRERLDWFFPEFRDLYFQLLREHLGGELASVLAALNQDAVQLYFRSLQAMQPKLRDRLQQLGERMASALAGATD